MQLLKLISTRNSRRFLPCVVAVAVFILFSGCDLAVDNPGNIQDEDLDNPDAIPAIVAGVQGDFGVAMVQSGGGGWVIAGSMLTDELVHVGTWVGLRGLSDGQTRDNWVESQGRWATASRARWVAEDGIRRVERIQEEYEDEGPISFDEAYAQLNLWAGHANRAMGDNFGNAVIDGGPMESHTVYYDRAIDFLEEAESLAAATNQPDIRRAAIGGLAQIYMMREDWDQAVAYAEQIDTDFVFNVTFSENSGRENNDIFWWVNRRNETSVWGTPFAEWGQNLSEDNPEGDPRVVYDVSEELGGDSRRPFYRQWKFESYGDPVPLVKGTEMRLIEAEAALVQDNNVGTVEEKINEVRMHHNATQDYTLPMVSVDEDNAWDMLMKERGIELWLEGRRLPDMRRWQNTPGDVPFSVVREANPGQSPSTDPVRNVIDSVEGLYLEVSENEKRSNPNL